MDHKHTTFDVKAVNEDGQFEGYASVFSVVDNDMDVVERGAFTNTLAERFSSGNRPKMLWQHDPREVIGVWTEMREDERGLFVRGKILKDVSRGSDALALLRAGALDGMSIGYKTKESFFEGPNQAIRKLTEIDLYEVSLVTFSSNPLARVTDVKSIETIRDFEGMLRDVGYSQQEAKMLASSGWKDRNAQRDDAAAQDGLKALQTSIDKLKEAFNA